MHEDLVVMKSRGVLPTPEREHAFAFKLTIFAVFVFQFVLPSRATATVPSSRPSAVSLGPGLAVAFTDFDGDSQPDVAGVQLGRAGAYESEYWIQLRLSAVGNRAIVLYGPSGGLQISARDVNGDHFPDLVVTTSWLQQPVAIYLNDGSGGFSRVDPSEFPFAFTKSETHWTFPGDDKTEAACIPQESRTEVHPSGSWSLDSIAQTFISFKLENTFAGEFFFSLHLGRAPPLFSF